MTKTEDRIYLAHHPKTTVAVLRELSKDTHYVVRYHVAMNHNTPLDLLRELAKDEEYDVRSKVAYNPNTPDDILRNLVKDEAPWVRNLLVSNHKVSINILILAFEYEKNLKYPDNGVINSLYRNKKLPNFAKRVIETLYGDWI